MKRIINIIIPILLCNLSASAQQVVEDGFYRINNYGTGRYIHIIDNKTQTKFDAEYSNIMDIMNSSEIIKPKLFSSTFNPKSKINFTYDLNDKPKQIS
mgnify:CR=1 FL=1